MVRPEGGRASGLGPAHLSGARPPPASAPSSRDTFLIRQLRPAPACGGSRQWEEALALLEGMGPAGVSKNAITFNAAISACERGGQWQLALQLMERMRGEAEAPGRLPN